MPHHVFANSTGSSCVYASKCIICHQLLLYEAKNTMSDSGIHPAVEIEATVLMSCVLRVSLLKALISTT